MRLELAFLNELLRVRSPELYHAVRFLPWMERQGARSLAAFYFICRDVIDRAESRDEMKKGVALLHRLFEDDECGTLLDEKPNLKLAREAWLLLEEDFSVSRVVAQEFFEGLETEANDQVPRSDSSREALIGYCYKSAGVLGLALGSILKAPPAAEKSLVSIAIGLRLTELSKKSEHEAGNQSREMATYAAVLLQSARRSYPDFPLRHRLAISTGAALLKERHASWIRKVDVVVDDWVRQAATVFTLRP